MPSLVGGGGLKVEEFDIGGGGDSAILPPVPTHMYNNIND